MFHPMVAGVTIPGVGIFGLMLAPYIDKNPTNKPEDRKFAISIFTLFIMFWAVLVIIGSLLPGPGLQLHLPVARRRLLRPVGAEHVGQRHHPPRRPGRPRRHDGGLPLRHRPPAGRRPRPRRTRAADDARPRRPPTDLPVPVGAAPRRGRELERAVALERSRHAAPPDVSAPPPPPALPPDEESLGVTRRQFLNRGIVTTMVAGPLRASAPPCVAMLWPTLSGGFGSKIRRRQGRRHHRRRSAPRRSPSTWAPAGFYINPYPKDAWPQGQEGRRPTPPSSRATSRASSPSTRSASTSAAGCRGARRRSGSSAPATARSTTGWARRRVGRRPGASTASSSPSTGGAVVVDTKMVIPGPPIGTNTTGQESEGPHCIGAVGGH